MVYTPVIDDKPEDDIICSLHCVTVGANVGIIEGVSLGVHDGTEVGTEVGEDVGITVGELVGVRDGSKVGTVVGLIVGWTVGNLVGNDVGSTVPVGSHSNTYLSYELKAILDIRRYCNSPLRYAALEQCLPICPVDTLAIFLAELTNAFITTLSLYIVRVLVLVSYTDP